MRVVDQVLFKMPQDRELQFPAMAVLQAFVNSFQAKMKSGVQPAPPPSYHLRYQVDMPKDDWLFFKTLGLSIVQQQEKIERPDLMLDFTEQRLELFKDSGKHVCQIYGIMSGVACPPLPVIRKVAPKIDGEPKWALVRYKLRGGIATGGDELAAAKDAEWTGVIGYAGWETYLAASMGLPLIEILPRGRPRNWLSKWTSSVYRMVEETIGMEEDVDRAKENLEAVLCSLVAADKQIV